MRNDVAGVDRLARLVIGPTVPLAGIAGDAGPLVLAGGPVPLAPTSVVGVLVGAIPPGTGLLEQCPSNRVLGFDTDRRHETGASDAPPGTP